MNTIATALSPADALSNIRVTMTNGSVETFNSAHVAGAWSGYLIVEEVTQASGAPIPMTEHQPHYLLMAAIVRVEVGVDEAESDPVEQSMTSTMLNYGDFLDRDGELAGISG